MAFDTPQLLYALSALMIFLGLLGTVLPMLPGVPLAFLGMLLAAWVGDFREISVHTVIVLAVLTALSLAIDLLASAWGAKRAGASKTAMLGAGIGAYVLTELPGDLLKPYVAAYLALMGVYVLLKALREIEPIHVEKRVGPLGFVGGLIDAIGGGGWGPIVTSTLLARGNHTRYTIGTVNAVEFFVTLTSSAVFIAAIGVQHWNIVLGLALGGLCAAPVAGYLAKRVPHRPMMAAVGLLIIGSSGYTLWKTFLA